jgi:glucose/arabinose dehydrogenase
MFTRKIIESFNGTLRKLPSRRAMSVLALLFIGVLFGGLLFVDEEYGIRYEMQIGGGRALVIAEDRSFFQSSRLALQEVLRSTRSTLIAVSDEITWKMGRSVEQSWIQETNLLNLRIRSTASGELRNVTRAVGGTHVGALAELTSEEFVLVTRSGMVLVYDEASLAITRRIELDGITATGDPGTGIRDVKLISTTDTTARYFATHAIADTEPYNCTRIALIAFTVPMVGGAGGEQGTSVPEQLWADDECVPATMARNGTLSGRLWLDGDVEEGTLYLAVGDVSVEHPEGSIFGTLSRFRFFDGNLLLPTAAGWDEMVPLTAEEAAVQVLQHQQIDITSFVPWLVSKGFRNPAGLAIAGGHTYIANQGPKGGDSLNLAAEGTDFGWPRVSYGTEYTLSGYPSPGNNSVGEFDAPSYVWLPSPAISDMDVNRTASLDSWFNEADVGDLLLTSLKGRHLYRCRTSASTGEVVYCETIYIGERLRDVLSTRSALILLADRGHLYRIIRN